MSVSDVTAFTIDNETDADEYLEALLASKNASMDEALTRAQKYIEDARIKRYFLDKARIALNSAS